MSRNRRRRGAESVELNLAAMLDMAFQLLTFFILTFRPAPLEGQINLRLPPAQVAVAVGPPSLPPDVNPPVTPRVDPLADLATLDVEVLAAKGGAIGSLRVGGRSVDDVSRLDRQLGRYLADPALPFRRVMVHVGSGLRYDALMSIVDVCSRQKLAGGDRLTALSFVEVAE